MRERIIPKNGTQTDRKWFEISISQKVPTRENAYYIEFAYRNGNDVEDVVGFISNLDETMSAIVNKIGDA